jgi:mandelamide amidase
MALLPPAGDRAAEAPRHFPPLPRPTIEDDRWSAFIAFAPEGAAPQGTGPLSGVTFAVKNNIDAIGFATRAGSPAIDAPIASVDAAVVQRLKQRGAVCVGTLNMHELALGTTSANAFFGTVGNPRAPGRSAGGSSGGSAAAVAAGLVSFSLSTDTGGSARIPAAHCGVVGLRPTSDRYPGEGVLTLSPSRDTVGVIASTVAQVAIVDAVIAGGPTLEALDLRDVRIGVPRAAPDSPVAGEVTEAMTAVQSLLVELGVTLVEVDLEPLRDARAALAVVAFEAPRSILARRGILTELPELTGSELAEIADFIEDVASTDVREVLASFIAEPVTNEAYRAALTRRSALEEAWARLFARNGVQAIMAPTVPILPPPSGATTVRLAGADFPEFPLSIRTTDPSAFAGLPSVSIPIPRAVGEPPLGLGLDGPRGRDRDVLAIALLLEQHLTAFADRISFRISLDGEARTS